MHFNPIVLFLIALIFGGQAGYFWMRQGYYRRRLWGRAWVARGENPREFGWVVLVFSTVALSAAATAILASIGLL